MAHSPTTEENVEAILCDGPGVREKNLKSLLRAVSGLTGRVETANCDLKTAFKDSNRGWVNLAKDIVAMSNSGGGAIVFGVDDNGRRVGLKQSLLSLMDPARINGQIESKAPGARVSTSYYEITFYRLRYGFLCVHPQEDLIVFEKEWGYKKPNGSDQIVIRRGVLYARGVGESRPARQADITLMVKRLIETGSKALLAKIEKIATLPLDSGIVALEPGSESRGIHLVDSEPGLPVKVTSEGEDAIPITEVLSADLPFPSKQAELVNQVRIWRAGHPENLAHRHTLNSWYLVRKELELSDEPWLFRKASGKDSHICRMILSRWPCCFSGDPYLPSWSTATTRDVRGRSRRARRGNCWVSLGVTRARAMRLTSASMPLRFTMKPHMLSDGY